MFMFVLNFVWNEAIDYLFSLNLGSSGLEVLVLFFLFKSCIDIMEIKIEPKCFTAILP